MTAENEPTNVVEMDAIDIDEWDRDRHTPRAHDTNLAELVRQSTAAEAAKPEPVIKALLKTGTAHTTRTQRTPSTTLPTPQPIQNTLVSKAKVDDAWADEPKPAPAPPPAVPRTKTSPNTMRRTGAVPVVPPQAQVAKPSKPVAPVEAKVEPPKRAEPPKPVAPPKRAESPKAVALVDAKVEPPKRAEAPKPIARPPTPAPVATKPIERPPTPAPVATKPIEPPSRPSEPEMLPPPPAIAPATDFTTREPSVVVDLGDAPISGSPPVVAPPPSVWDRPSTPVAAAARPTPSPDALDASIPQIAPNVESDRIRPRSILATVFPTSRSRRTVALAGAGAAVLAIVLGLALGGHHATEAPATIAKPSAPAPAVSPARPTTTQPTPPVRVAAAATPVTPAPVVSPVAPPRKAPARRIVRRKPVVVDYDKKPDATTTADHDESLARARGAYAAGNQHLFAGEAAAAIASYHQALAIYPNYVAGYRGLGLAYAQQGDTAAALKAFKTYVKLAPAAKDVALIQKRIARLSAR